MYTEVSDKIDRSRIQGWILYEAACPLCLDLLRRVRNPLAAANFRFEPLQSPWVREFLSLPEDQLLAEMRVLTRTGQVLGGAPALVHLARSLKWMQRPWWAWLVLLISRAPRGSRILRSGYRWIAARRHCRTGSCQIGNLPTTEREVRQ
jgi:predicted DCC family thiol-disulfide oxidoreductase YuxK